ncbi:MAG: sulfite exporter TauE/SafE family protein [Gemmatimonadetes bacterium]|nr:sulfite exporter TauE/SafE family protein [Gemmatimonadota bacterium]
MGAAPVLAVFAAGLLAGLLSGLVGVGGGVLMVPFLYFFYARPGWSGVAPPPDVATVAAHATSLFVILPTSVRGAWAYHRRGLVVWRAVWPIGAAAAVAAALASRFAVQVEPRWLRLIFAGFLLWNAAHVLRPPRPRAEGAPERPLRLSLPVTLGVGAAVGFFSALLGVGGGLVSIPLLLQVVGIDLRRVAATSLAIITLTSLGGALAYMLAAPPAPLRPGLSAGYVDFAAAAVLTAGTVLSVGWGAELNRRMNPRTLAMVFAAVFTVLGVQLLVENV